jgi:hypothetical protein
LDGRRRGRRLHDVFQHGVAGPRLRRLQLQPWLRTIEQAFTNDRDLFTDATFCEFLIDGLLRADSKTRAEVYTAALDP